jgi:hypothetical protein
VLDSLGRKILNDVQVVDEALYDVCDSILKSLKRMLSLFDSFYTMNVLCLILSLEKNASMLLLLMRDGLPSCSAEIIFLDACPVGLREQR